MFDTLYSQIGAVFTVLVVAFAFLKGDEPERVGAAVYVLAWFASMLVQDDAKLHGVQWSMFAVDTLALLVFGALAWKSGRAWPVWVCALQLLAVMSHIMSMVDIRPPAASFYAAINLSQYGILVVLAVGAFWAWQERRAEGLE
jgi:hypothetical protein